LRLLNKLELLDVRQCLGEAAEPVYYAFFKGFKSLDER